MFGGWGVCVVIFICLRKALLLVLEKRSLGWAGLWSRGLPFGGASGFGKSGNLHDTDCQPTESRELVDPYISMLVLWVRE